MGYEERYAYLLHDRDTLFSAELDESIQRLGLRVADDNCQQPIFRDEMHTVEGMHHYVHLAILLRGGEEHITAVGRGIAGVAKSMMDF